MEETIKGKRTSVFDFFVRYWLAFLMVILVFVFGGIAPSFMTSSNLLDIVSSTCVNGICALGLMMIMSSGEIDYACGSEMVIGAVGIAKIMCVPFFCEHSYGYFLAILIVLAMLVLFGLLNAFLHIKVGIPAFIATLGTSLTVDGVIMVITKCSSVSSMRWPPISRFLGTHYLFGVLPMPAVLLVLFSVVIYIYTSHTKSGKKIYAVGANAAACRYVGIDENRVKLKGFISCSVLCGFAGIIDVSILNTASHTLGGNILFNSLTALMLGATCFVIGVYNVLGTVLSALFIIMLQNAFVIFGFPTYLKELIQGGILVLSVTMVMIIRVRRSRKG